ncbi:MAG: TonB-dependent receptor [Rikenellaceae bacterium]|nr:TonB-dependent receptor [Rikenellaceae bacterium]
MLKRALLLLMIAGGLGLSTARATNNTLSTNSTLQSEQQPSVTGQVVDAQGRPIPYANVSVRKASGEVLAKVGTITDDKGMFSLPKLPTGEYVAVVAFLGYQSAEKPFAAGSRTATLGVITLKEDAQAIDKVEVTGVRSQMQFDIDKKVFNVDQNIASTGGSASDILNNIPSVEVDGDGEVSLRGNSSVTVWINGKESGITADNRAQILEQMPAESIDKIEVITNPSAKFSPEGTSGIINIVLKENRSSGYYGGVNATIDSKLGGNVGANINYTSSVADFYVNMGYRRHVRDNGSTTLRRNLDESGNELSWLRSVTDGDGAGNNGFARLGATFHLTKKDDLGFAGFGMLGGRSNDETVKYTSTVPGSYTSAVRRTDGGHKMMGGHLELNYRHKFGTDHTLDAIVAYDVWDMDNGSDYTQTSYFPTDTTRSLQRQHSDMRNGGWTAQIDYLNKLNENHRIEAGYKGTLNSENSPTVYSAGTSVDDLAPLYALYNDFYYKQDVHALYFNYAGKVRRFGYQVGLRGEHTSMRTRSLGYQPTAAQQEWYTNQYFKVFPSVFVSYSFPGDHELQVNYTRRIQRPRGHQLNSFRNMSDSLNVSYGNPMLDPQNANAFELNYIKSWENHILSASAYYRSTDDVIQRISYLDGGVMMSTFANVTRSQSAGVELVSKNKLWTRLDLTTTLNLYYSSMSGFTYRPPVEGAEVVTGEGNSNFSWDIRMVANVTLPLGFSVQATGGYNSRRVVAQGYSLGNYFVDAGVRKSFEGGWSVALNCRDIFNSRGRHSVTEGKGFIQDSERWWGGRRFRLTASYSFGNMKPIRPKNSAAMSEAGDMGGYGMGEE